MAVVVTILERDRDGKKRRAVKVTYEKSTMQVGRQAQAVMPTFIPNPHLHPPGGYVYQERDGTVVTGTNWDNLIAKVQAVRVMRKWEIGDVWADICLQVCAKHPHICKREHGGARSTDPNLNGTAVSVTDWLLHWQGRAAKGEEIKFVSPEEAKRRAAICLKCPLHFKWPSCPHCNKPLSAARWRILKGQAHANANLGACYACRFDCYVAVSLEDSETAFNPEGIPPECWRRG